MLIGVLVKRDILKIHIGQINLIQGSNSLLYLLFDSIIFFHILNFNFVVSYARSWVPTSLEVPRLYSQLYYY